VSGWCCDAVLFDLDGTVLDTAPDLLATMNTLRSRRGLPAIALNGFRDQVSRGARAMLGVGLPGFAHLQGDALATIVDEFLAAYEEEIFRDSVLFPGMASVMNVLDARGIPMAIVTNKPVRMAERLLDAMQLSSRFAVLLGGDSLAERKPHPLPVLTACARMGVDPVRAVFVGDDARDVQAGAAAGCRTVAVAWGYVDVDALPQWGADAVIERPDELLALIRA
jgi:2-phosphoglycolate phosphatase